VKISTRHSNSMLSTLKAILQNLKEGNNGLIQS